MRDIKFSGRALVVGTGECVIDDLASFMLLPRMPFEIFIVNEAFKFMPEWDHWCSLHPERMTGWRKAATALGRTLTMRSTHLPDLDADDWEAAMRKGDRVDFPHQRHDWRVSGVSSSGSSGLFATRLAIRFGYDKVVLAGVPMNRSPHHGRTEPWEDSREFSVAWSAAERELHGKVRSGSGWTRDLLGEPTKHWWCQ